MGSRHNMEDINQESQTVETLEDLAKLADYSLLNTLNCDPHATTDVLTITLEKFLQVTMSQ